MPAAAVVARNSGIDTKAVLQYVAGRVAGYKRLRAIFIVAEIPRTAAGKTQIHVIKARCLADDRGP